MSVKIRLMRVGKKKQPTYRVVVSDARSPRDGRYIEIVGQYRPRDEPSHFVVDDEKVLGWLRQGAQPTDQVHRLLVGVGLWERYESDRARTSQAARTAAAKAKGAAAAKVERDAAAKLAAEAGAEAAAKAEAEAAAKAEAEAAAKAAESEPEAPEAESEPEAEPESAPESEEPA